MEMPFFVGLLCKDPVVQPSNFLVICIDIEVLNMIITAFRRQLDDECQSTKKYRTLDGSCNNLKNPYIGSSFQPFARFLPPEYDDGNPI